VPSYPGIYRAKAVQFVSPNLTAYVPQVFGDVAITVTEWITTPVVGLGWVMFQGGDPSFPVWLGLAGAGSGGGGTVTDVVWVGPDAPADPDTELWWDTDDNATGDVGEVFVGPEAPPTDSSYQLWYDTDGGVLYALSGGAWVPTGGGGGAGDPLWVGPSAPVSGYELWYDTDETDPAVTTALVRSGGRVGPDNAGPTVGSNPLSFFTENLPDFGVSGRLHVWCSAYYSKTVSSDRFNVSIWIDGVQQAIQAESNPTSGNPTVVPLSPSVSLPIAAGTHTIQCALTRGVGTTGTATPASGAQCTFQWEFIADGGVAGMTTAEADTRYVNAAGDSMTGDLSFAGSTLVSNGARLPMLQYGTAPITTNASGAATINHTFGRTPNFVFVGTLSSTISLLSVTAMTSTTFTILARNIMADGAPQASASMTIQYLIVGIV